jgi:hypothetical protein
MASYKRPRGSSGDGEQDDALEVLKSVENFQKIENPELKDLSSLLIKFIKFSVDNKRLDKLEQNVNDLEEDMHLQKLDIGNNTTNIAALEKKFTAEIDSLKKTIEELKAKNSDLEESNQKNLGTNNFLLQDRIDNDLIVRGFPAKPDCKVACEKFLEAFHLDSSVVRTHYYFPYTLDSGKITHNLIISFNEFEVKMKILESKKQRGPLLLNCIQPHLAPPDQDVTLTYSNRLTKFNLYAIYHLNKAKDNKIIHSIRYHNLFFSIKETEKGGWKRITNMSDLEKYMIPGGDD